ncbi:hypothetical protein MLD38_017507 [Melastoma candidum]|uniref:Uncharacterized protein n=1 Tax=Melastoma candidum TaxID=119954 RepID=A0ACB9QQA2_9MYRT|nr:hypothetical protein MLD38_017507 [Melastoma candidum]
MASREGRHNQHKLVPLAALINREMKNQKLEKPTLRFGCAAQSKKGEDYSHSTPVRFSPRAQKPGRGPFPCHWKHHFPSDLHV